MMVAAAALVAAGAAYAVQVGSSASAFSGLGGSAKAFSSTTVDAAGNVEIISSDGHTATDCIGKVGGKLDCRKLSSKMKSDKGLDGGQMIN